MSGDPDFFYKLAAGQPVPFPVVVAERIFNRDAIDPSVPLDVVKWKTGEATLELKFNNCRAGEICGFHITHFTCVVLLERLYELMAEVGGIYLSTGDPIVTHESERNCLGTDDGTDWIVVADSVDDFIHAAQIVFGGCNPDAYTRTA